MFCLFKNSFAKQIVGKHNFPDRSKRLASIIKYWNLAYIACKGLHAINPIMICNYGFILNCTTVCQAPKTFVCGSMPDVFFFFFFFFLAGPTVAQLGACLL